MKRYEHTGFSIQLSDTGLCRIAVIMSAMMKKAFSGLLFEWTK